MTDWESKLDHLVTEIDDIANRVSTESPDAGFQALSRLDKTAYQLDTLAESIDPSTVSTESRSPLERLLERLQALNTALESRMAKGVDDSGVTMRFYEPMSRFQHTVSRVKYVLDRADMFRAEDNP